MTWSLSVHTLDVAPVTSSYQAFLFAKCKGYSNVIRRFHALEQNPFVQEVTSELG